MFNTYKNILDKDIKVTNLATGVQFHSSIARYPFNEEYFVQIDLSYQLSVTYILLATNNGKKTSYKLFKN